MCLAGTSRYARRIVTLKSKLDECQANFVERTLVREATFKAARLVVHSVSREGGREESASARSD